MGWSMAKRHGFTIGSVVEEEGFTAGSTRVTHVGTGCSAWAQDRHAAWAKLRVMVEDRRSLASSEDEACA